MIWDVIKDKSNLDGNNWEEVRDIHDTQALRELEQETAEGNDEITKIYAKRFAPKEILEMRTQSKPHWEYFIFADEESVRSVIDADIHNTRGKLGTYFITIVQSNFVCKTEIGWSDDENTDKDPNGVESVSDPIPREACWQHFKMWKLVDVYASLLYQQRPNNYAVEEDGLSWILRYM